MVRSEETDVADSTELQGLCCCAQPQGTEGLREEKKPSGVERECPSAEALMEATEETACNKGFSRYYYPQTWCFFGEWLKHKQVTTNGDKQNWEIWAVKAQAAGKRSGSNTRAGWAGTAQKPSSPHGFKPRQHHALQKGKSKFINTADDESRVSPFD